MISYGIINDLLLKSSNVCQRTNSKSESRSRLSIFEVIWDREMDLGSYVFCEVEQVKYSQSMNEKFMLYFVDTWSILDSGQVLIFSCYCPGQGNALASRYGCNGVRKS